MCCVVLLIYWFWWLLSCLHYFVCLIVGYLLMSYTALQYLVPALVSPNLTLVGFENVKSDATLVLLRYVTVAEHIQFFHCLHLSLTLLTTKIFTKFAWVRYPSMGTLSTNKIEWVLTWDDIDFKICFNITYYQIFFSWSLHVPVIRSWVWMHWIQWIQLFFWYSLVDATQWDWSNESVVWISFFKVCQKFVFIAFSFYILGWFLHCYILFNSWVINVQTHYCCAWIHLTCIFDWVAHRKIIWHDAVISVVVPLGHIACTELLPAFCGLCGVYLLDITMSHTKTAERVEMLFVVCTWVGPSNHVVVGSVPEPPGAGSVLEGLGPALSEERNIWCDPQLFTRWQQRCGHSLSVLQ